MTNFCVNLGDAFLLETPPNGMHLYIVIALIDEDSDTYLFVNITSLRPNSDTSCILKPGAGVPKFILYDSAVAYKFAREISSTQISDLIDEDSCTRQGTCSPNILYKIQMGAISSKQIKIKYKNIIKALLKIS